MRDSSFADYLRRAMLAVGIDPDQRGAAAVLARKADLSESQTSRWLRRGDQPTIENLRKLAPVLRLGMSDLLVAAGYVTAGELGQATTTAEQGIRDDPDLSERERRMLLRLLGEMRDRYDEDLLSAPRAPGPVTSSNGGETPPEAKAV